MVKGGGGLDHISWKIKWSFHNSQKIKQAFHASRKKEERFSLNKSYILLHFEKLCPKQSLVNCFHYPSTSHSARYKKETEFLVLHITNGTIFLHCKIIRVVVGGVVIVFGELIISWVPQCRCAFSSLLL